MPSESVQALAQRLLAVEAARHAASHPHVHEAVRVCEKLRVALIRLAGAEAFTSLLQRALVLAGAGNPAIHAIIQLKPDGTLEGLDACRRHDQWRTRGGGCNHRQFVGIIGDVYW